MPKLSSVTFDFSLSLIIQSADGFTAENEIKLWSSANKTDHADYLINTHQLRYDMI